jgi:hypothetical protein
MLSFENNIKGDLMYPVFFILLLQLPTSTPVSQPTSQPTSYPAPEFTSYLAPELTPPKSEVKSAPIRSFAPIGLKAVAELGFVGVISHKVQFSQTGTLFDYRSEGGQDILFRFERLSLEAPWKRNEFVFLYQPLELTERVVLEREIMEDNVVFPAGTPIETRYSFPFWRGSYLRHLKREGKNELAFGGSLQIRDASISFRSLDGLRFQSNRDVGPVPLLKIRAKRHLSDSVWLGTELDGIYAPIKYLNGGNVDVVGALLDASVRLGFDFPKGVQSFVNLRYLGGGAEGTGKPQGTSDGFVKNWLNFYSVSIGFTYDFKNMDPL